MAYYLSPIGNGQSFVNQNGVALSLGFIYTYLAGTTTPQATYTSAGIALPNPIPLDTGGRPSYEIFLAQGISYKFVITDATLAQQGPTLDNIVGVNDPTNFSTASAEWIASGFSPVYGGATTFSVAGNGSGTFKVGRRVQCTVTAGTVYGTITAVSGSGPTTITLDMDGSTVLDSGLSVVNVAFLGTTGSNASFPTITQNDFSARNLTATGTLGVTGTSTLGVVNLTSGSIAGIMTAPTAALGTSTTQLATTAFVNNTAAAIQGVWGYGNAAAQAATGIVNFQTAAYTLNNATYSSGQITLTNGGTYFIQASLTVNNNTTNVGNVSITIRKNGAATQYTNNWQVGTGFQLGSISVGGALACAANDTIDVYATIGNNAAVITAYGAFSGVRIF